MTSTDSLPRWSLAGLSLTFCTIFGWAAVMLPWRDFTVFAILTTIVAVAHALTGVLALADRPGRAKAWRLQSVLALVYLLYMTWNLVVSATYIAELYGGLGRGVAVALGLVWLIAAGLTIPLSVWGLAVTGGLAWPRSGKVASAAVVLAAATSVWRASADARADTVDELGDPDAVRQELTRAFGTVAANPEARSLMHEDAAVCDAPPDERTVTVIVTFWAGDAPRTWCRQGPSLRPILDAVAAELPPAAATAPLSIDVVTGVQSLDTRAPMVDELSLRPGLDGVCEGPRCLVPWQLLAIDAFRVAKPIPVIPELRFGFDPIALRKRLAEPGRTGAIPRGLEGFIRIETVSFVRDREGEVHRLRRGRTEGPVLEPSSVRWALDAASNYILGAIGEDGRFEYKVDPFTGQLSYRGFSLPRQAGTTLVVCELAPDRERAREVATSALAMLASTARRSGDVQALAYPANEEVTAVEIGSTALASIAFLSCRDLVGDRFDDDIDRMTRFLLAMQRPDGSFYPRFDLEAGQPIPGPDPLYGVGQALFALTLLEQLSAAEPGRFAESEVVRSAVQRAMDYVAEDYWSGFASNFFFMEENWHCLAARASLGHHRHDGYERFCLDYVRYKTRLILDEDSRVDPDLIGGYGFGNVLLPHNTGSAGFGEAMSAAMALMRARGESTAEAEVPLRRALTFLLHHQWREPDCFACTPPRRPDGSVAHSIVGGWSEHMGSPEIRIDYVQHAMAALGHGGRMLGLLDARE